MSEYKDYKLKVTTVNKTEFSVDTSDEGVKVTIMEGTEQKIAVDSISYRKEIYKPCRIECEMVINAVKGVLPLLSEISGYLKDAAVSLFSEVSTIDSNGKKTVSTSNVLVKDCLIFEVESSLSKISGDTSRRVKVVAFSPDYKLTFAKYSKCYTSRKFLSEVISGELNNYNLGNLLRKTDNVVDVGNLMFLTYKQADKMLEFIQPYLVQYNETFHDFIVRVASRCGEFLYYENGFLNVGLALSRKMKTKVNDKGEVQMDKDGNPIKENVLESKTVSGIEEVCLRRKSYDDSYGRTKDYRRDFVNSEKNTGEASEKMRDSELCQDDYMFSLEKSKYDSLSGEWLTFPHHIKNVCNSIAQSTGIGEFVGLVAVAYGLNLVKAAFAKKNANKTFDKNYFDKNKIPSEKLSGNKMTPFRSFITDSAGNTLYYDYYEKMRKCEESVSRERLVIKMEEDCYDPVYLGDLIKTEQTGNNIFIVVKIDAEKCKKVKVTPERELKVNGKSFVVKGGSVMSMKRTVIIEAVPFRESSRGSGKPIPPLSDVPPFRFSAPQAAEVVDGEDPMRLGRVTIKYPWQNDNTASPYIRVSTKRASDMGGTYYGMSKNEEVLVDYVNGNVERPFVVGQYYTNKNRPMYGGRVFSTAIGSKNGHCIRMADPDNALAAIGSFFSPLKWFLSYAPAVGPKTSNIGLKKLMGTMEITDAAGLCSILLKTEDRRISIASPLGDVVIDAFTGINISAPNGDIMISGKNISIEAGNNVRFISGKNVPEGVSGYFGADLASFKKSWGKAGKKLLVKEVSGFFDLKLFRCLYDTFLRPVDGSLQLNSSRFVAIDAGKGVAEPDSRSFVKDNDDLQPYLRKLCDSIDSISGVVDTLALRYIEWRNGYRGKIADIDRSTFIKNNLERNSFESIKQKFREHSQRPVDNDFSFLNNVTDDDKQWVKELIYREYDWFDENKPSTYRQNELDRLKCESADPVKTVVDGEKGNLSFLKDNLGGEDIDIREEVVTLKRKMIYKMIKEAIVSRKITYNGGDFPQQCPDNNENWNQMFDNMRYEEEKPSVLGSVADAAVSALKDSAGDIGDFSGKWKADMKPKILFSDQEGYTLEFTPEGGLHRRENVRGSQSIRHLQAKGKEIRYNNN